MNNVLKPNLESMVTAHTVYFCAFADSEVCPKKNTKELGVGSRQALSAHIIKSVIFPSDPIFHAMNFRVKFFRFG